MRAYDRNNWRPPPLPRLDAFPHANMTLGRENFRRCAAHISATAAYLAVTVLELASLALCSHQPPGGLTRRVRMLSCSFFLQLGNPWGHPATIRAGNGALETLHDAVYLIPKNMTIVMFSEMTCLRGGSKRAKADLSIWPRNRVRVGNLSEIKNGCYPKC